MNAGSLHAELLSASRRASAGARDGIGRRSVSSPLIADCAATGQGEALPPPAKKRQRPRACRSRRALVGDIRLERMTSTMSTWRSNQLS
jgi:hypothetical protein